MAVVTTQQKVAALYTAIFNRAPDQAGLNFWTAQINAGTSFASIAAGFAQHEVFTTGIGALDNAGYVSALYTNILGSAGDTAGIAYWTARLAAGESKAAIVAEFVNGSLTIDIPALLASGGISAADAAAATIRQQTLTNKADVGIYFANTLGAASNLNPATVSTSKAGLEADPIYKASQAAIAGVDSTAASVQTAKDAIAVAAGSANPAEALLGHTFTLTAGADTIVGGAASDVINALTVKADGSDASTLTGFDSIDGGAGNDTLNIYSDGTLNASLPTSATVKNVETINIYNQDAVKAFGAAAGIDASKFVGATAINQIGTVAAGVTNLAAGTVAGFNAIAAGALNVTAAAAAATAAVSLTNVDDATSLTVAGDALNAVTITGNVVDATPATPIDDLDLTVTAGKDVESLSINTSINSKLTVTNAGGKVLSTVDASASTGNIDLDTVELLSSVATVKTGSGADKVGLTTSLNTTVKAASVSTGAGNDTINVEAVVGAAAAGQTVTVDAGEGDDVIQLELEAGIGYNVAAGAGDDTVVIAGTVKTTDKIDGGAGTDTVSLAGQATARIADDFIVFNKVLTNFETLKFSSTEGDVDTEVAFDASQLAANYTTLDFATASNVDNVGTQALVANGNLNAEAAGYINVDEGTPAATAITYAGTLNITDVNAGTTDDAIQAHASTVNLTVKGVSASSATVNSAVLTGEAKSATVTLSAGTSTQGTAATTDDVLVASKVTITQGTDAEELKDLASLTLSGNGTAVVNVGALVAAESKLVNVDASGLNSVDIAGKATIGLQYTSFNSAAETIKLGAGQDTITLNASTYGKMDVIQGLNLVASAADAKAVDATKSDVLDIKDVVLSTTGALGFTTTQTDLDLALKDAATYSKANSNTDVAFHMGGNTYVFHDSVAGNGLIDATDTVVQITGQVNLDLLASSLAVA